MLCGFSFLLERSIQRMQMLFIEQNLLNASCFLGLGNIQHVVLAVGC